MTDPRMTPTNDAPVTVEQCDRELFDALGEALMYGWDHNDRSACLPVIAAHRHRLAALASAPAGDHVPDAGNMIAPAGDGEYRVNPDRSGLERMTMMDDEMGLHDEPMPPSTHAVPEWHGEAVHKALLSSSEPVERTELGDLPSRIQGWIGKARARGGDRIELDFATVDLLLAAALARPRAAVGERDVDDRLGEEAIADARAMLVNQQKDAIARIIDSRAFDGPIYRNLGSPDSAPERRADALDKADAILALQSPPAKVEGV